MLPFRQSLTVGLVALTLIIGGLLSPVVSAAPLSAASAQHVASSAYVALPSAARRLDIPMDACSQSDAVHGGYYFYNDNNISGLAASGTCGDVGNVTKWWVLDYEWDGNLRIYQYTYDDLGNLTNTTLKWQSGTAIHCLGWAGFQTDGNFVAYDCHGHAYWSSRTNGHGGATLWMQCDGNLVIYNSANQAIWSTHTYNGSGCRYPVYWSH
jgi:YD repeat-containing protein